MLLRGKRGRYRWMTPVARHTLGIWARVKIFHDDIHTRQGFYSYMRTQSQQYTFLIQ